jgi:hypothetical protein
MKTLFDLAAIYKDWARQDDEIASLIVATSMQRENQARQLGRARSLQQEAQRLRERALRLRGSASVAAGL